MFLGDQLEESPAQNQFNTEEASSLEGPTMTQKHYRGWASSVTNGEIDYYDRKQQKLIHKYTFSCGPTRLIACCVVLGQ